MTLWLSNICPDRSGELYGKIVGGILKIILFDEKIELHAHKVIITHSKLLADQIIAQSRPSSTMSSGANLLSVSNAKKQRATSGPSSQQKPVGVSS